MKHETELYEIDEGAFSQCPMGAVTHNSSCAEMQPPYTFQASANCTNYSSMQTSSRHMHSRIARKE